MKLSNFRFIKTKGVGFKKIHIAEVDIETGVLFWKKKETKKVACSSGSIYWYFIDTGEYTPDHQVENLRRAWEAKNEPI